MRDRAKKEKCTEEVAKFSDCCKTAGLLMTFKCKKQSDELKKCMEKWYVDMMQQYLLYTFSSRYQDADFKEECTKQYLEERRLYRLHGDKKPMKSKESEMF